MNPELRRFLLRGPEPDLAAALAVLHVRADVRGIEERAGECEAWLAGDVPAQLAAIAGVTVRELPVHPAMFAHTGLERDAVVWIAPDLCVRPPWVARPAGFAGIELVVPRGSAFGSGEHPSTRVALLALHRHWPASGSATFLDVGTGSGILSLYAAARGVGRSYACDVDRAAARAAAALVPGLSVACSSACAFDLAVDVVVANMTAAELATELPAIAGLARTSALLVLGGLRDAREVAACRARCAALGLGTAPVQEVVAEWRALTFKAAPPGRQ